MTVLMYLYSQMTVEAQSSFTAAGGRGDNRRLNRLVLRPYTF
jgi:hypothetical protein